MQGFARVLLEDYGPQLDEVGRDYLDRIVAGACRMDNLIQDLLVYSRLGHTELSLGPIPLSQLVREIVRQIQPDIDAKHAEVAWAGERDRHWGQARTMIRSSVMSSIAQRRPSRPGPESLTPP